MSNNNNDDYKGYKGQALETLQRFNALVWSDVEISTADGDFKGLILPAQKLLMNFILF